MATSKEIRWLPLESNPKCLTKMMHRLGVPSRFEWVDIIGFDDELLEFIPRPVYAVIFLYPFKETTEPDEAAQELSGYVKPHRTNDVLQPYFMRQTIHNACGTVALLHALLNNIKELSIKGPIEEYFECTNALSPQERGKFLETFTPVEKAHEDCARSGETETPQLEDKVDLHFVAIVESGGRAWQLDGNKPHPIDFGPLDPRGILHNAAFICRNWMDENPNCINFTAVALVDIQP